MSARWIVSAGKFRLRLRPLKPKEAYAIRIVTPTVSTRIEGAGESASDDQPSFPR
jgi:hypothetical protein